MGQKSLFLLFVLCSWDKTRGEVSIAKTSTKNCSFARFKVKGTIYSHPQNHNANICTLNLNQWEKSITSCAPDWRQTQTERQNSNKKQKGQPSPASSAKNGSFPPSLLYFAGLFIRNNFSKIWFLHLPTFYAFTSEIKWTLNKGAFRRAL